MNIKYKYCILAAGIGSRNSTVFGLHKGLLPIKNIAILSHLIAKLDPDVEIVIAVGYQADQIISYLQYIHPERVFKFIFIDKFSGLGSGPGYSLLQCKEFLQCPFILLPSDLYLDGDYDVPAPDFNWIGTAKISRFESKNYCLVSGRGDLIQLYYGGGDTAYNGLAGIHDYDLFWSKLEQKNNIHNNEYQVTFPINSLSDVKLIPFEPFHDTGTTESYLKIRESVGMEIVFPKQDETIYIDKGKVIKYFADRQKSLNRIARTSYLGKSIPLITKLTDNMFGYELIEAKLLSEINNEATLGKFFDFYKSNFLVSVAADNDVFQSDCFMMHQQKTYQRVSQLESLDINKIKLINGIEVPSVQVLLSLVPWGKITHIAFPSLFHGDLQPENILVDANNNFSLIDWRESFGKSLEVGDAYYDLGKLYHGLLINGTIFKNNNFDIIKNENSTEISFLIKSNLYELLLIFEKFCMANKLDWNIVKILGALQYINISVFYNKSNPAYSEFLFLFGKLLLTKYLAEIGIKYELPGSNRAL